MQINEQTTQNVTLDFAQPRSVQYANTVTEQRNVTLDNSGDTNVSVNMPQQRETNLSVDFSRTSVADFSTTTQRDTNINVEDAQRVVNLIFVDGSTPAAVNLGGPIVARKG
jgi:hypothetical protein